MHVTLIGVLGTFAALAAAAPYGGRQEALFSPTHSFTTAGCLQLCWPTPVGCPAGMSPELHQDCWTCCLNGSAKKALIPPTQTSANEICLRACFPEELKCPENWESKKLGNCWTCCLKEEENVKSAVKTVESGVCWRVCFPMEPQCPENWEAKQLGDCWTCCLKEEENIKSAVEALDGEVCLRACFQAEPQCPENWEAKQFGDCWTCCLKGGQNMKSDVKAVDSEVCLRACFPAEPQCPENWEAKQFGDCWTCCAKNQESVKLKSPLLDTSTSVNTIDQGLCWLVCLPQEPKCPEQWEARKMGSSDCWTCCHKESEEVAKASKSLASRPPCIPMCFDAPPKQCLFGSHPQRLEESCWTCCGGEIDSVSSTAIVLDETKTKAVSKTFSLTEPACVPVCFPPGPPVRCLFGYQPRFFEGCWTCCNVDQRATYGLDGLKVSGKSTAISKPLAVEGPPCVPVCHVAPTRCAFGYRSAMIEPGCWSCCMALELEIAASASMDLVMSNQEVCWRTCFPEQVQCPPSGHARNIGGECWSCCFGGDESIQKNTQSLITQLGTSSSRQAVTDDPCLLICMLEEPKQCGTNGYAKQFGSCWTCCLKTDAQDYQTISSGSSKTYSLISHSPSKQMVSHEDICLKVCMFEEPKCGEHMYAKQFGDCWTCCFKPQSDEVEQVKHNAGVATYPSICLRACFASADSCPQGFFPDPKSGDGCTVCCRKESENTSRPVVPAKQSKHTPSLANMGQICLKACFRSKDSCPENFFPDPSYDGDFCTICCTKNREDARLATAGL